MAMDLFNHHDYRYPMARHAELLAEAERYRLAAQARQGQRPFFYLALNGLGKILVAWGRLLQQRYNANPCPPPCPDPQAR
jgi:hypothetical protein